MSTFVMNGADSLDILWNIFEFIMIVSLGFLCVWSEFYNRNKNDYAVEDTAGVESMLPEALCKQIISTHHERK